MIGNYINIDYDKLPKKKAEVQKEPEKDSSSIKKLLSHPQYKDIIGLYTGKSEAKPVIDNGTLWSKIDGYSGIGGYGGGYSGGYAGRGMGGALPIMGAAAASTAATLRGVTKSPSKKSEPPVLDDIQGKTKLQDLPEGVEPTKPAESDKGIEAGLEKVKEPLVQLLDNYGLDPNDQQAILDILDNGLVNLGDDDSFELPEGVQSFKIPPEFKEKALNDILKRYPSLGPKILGDDPASKQEMDKLMDLLERYLEAKKYQLDRDAHKFNEEDEGAEVKRQTAEYNKRAGKVEYYPREKMDKKVNAKDASKSVTKEISRSNKEETVPESDIMSGSKGKAKEEAAKNFERLKKGYEVDTLEPKNKPASWQTKPGPWD